MRLLRIRRFSPFPNINSVVHEDDVIGVIAPMGGRGGHPSAVAFAIGRDGDLAEATIAEGLPDGVRVAARP